MVLRTSKALRSTVEMDSFAGWRTGQRLKFTLRAARPIPAFCKHITLVDSGQCYGAVQTVVRRPAYNHGLSAARFCMLV